MDKLLTISIAAYNVEKYLRKTLDSCVAINPELFKKVEIFIVDDGSKDSTGEIAKEYQEKYSSSINYIPKENGGHGSTVNYSMKNATGKYFMLLDGDDWVDSNQFEKLIACLEKEESDIVSCLYNMVDNDTLKATVVNQNSQFKNDCMYSAKDVLNSAKIFLAGLIIKTSILQSHPFNLNEKCFYVDMEYVTFPIPYVDTFIFYDLNVYQCRTALVGQSTSRLGTVRHADDHIKVAQSLVDFYNIQKNNNIDDFRLAYIFNMSKKVVEDVFLLPFAFPISDKTIRKKVLGFENYLKTTCKDLYDSKYRKKVNLMRKTGYIGWRIISVLEYIKSR